jgi:hypothetical protein
MTVKYEKVTLWTATDNLSSKSEIGALDYLVDYMGDCIECKILDFETSEELILVPKPNEVSE